GGQTQLVHELHVTNQLKTRATIEHLEVRDGSGAVVARYGSAELVALTSGKTPDARAVSLEPGLRVVIYFWIPLAARAPDTITHRLVATAGTDTMVVDVGVTAVARRASPALGPPLRGGPWVAVYAPALERGHRRVLFEHEGAAATIPARFAIDWIRIDSAGRLAAGDPQLVRSYYSYDAEVLAVAGARVAATRNAVAERSRLVHVAHGPVLASGNYVTLDLGDGHFVSYEHLKPGSVLVKPGEQVKRGQVIARVGFSGDGSHPHLHMHISNGATPMIGEGLPWTLATYQLLGGYAGLSAVFAGRRWTEQQGAYERRHELPAPNAVVMFPD
ncbi:MAG TPA: M23 family metallopeptidase, partial [Longimicrobiales bacterium]|nr:M23 family metallopeptidase [Longimicrobiales bacterium]